MLVTGVIAATGLPDGRDDFGEQAILVRGARAELADGSALDGSTLTMERAVRHLIEIWGPVPESVAMAGTTPTDVVRVRDHKGASAWVRSPSGHPRPVFPRGGESV